VAKRVRSASLYHSRLADSVVLYLHHTQMA